MGNKTVIHSGWLVFVLFCPPAYVEGALVIGKLKYSCFFCEIVCNFAA